MENYSKARTVERPSVCPFPDLEPDTPEVRVRDGSKIRNLLRYALSRMEPRGRAAQEPGEEGPEEEGGAPAPQEEREAAPPCKRIVFTASGKGVSKAITCAEILKRRLKGLHQLTRLLYSSVTEVWEPLEPGAGLDPLTVSRNLPAIWILLSAEPLDPEQPGYQAPRRYDALWAGSADREEAGGGGGGGAHRPAHRRKRGGGAEGGGGGRGRGRGSVRQAGRSRDAAKHAA